MMNAVLYIGVLTSEKIKHGSELEININQCLEIAQKTGCIIKRIFIDEFYKDCSSKRPGFVGMLKYCKKRKNNISAVIFSRNYILLRNISESAKIIKLMRKFDKRFKIITQTSELILDENFDTKPIQTTLK